MDVRSASTDDGLFNSIQVSRVLDSIMDYISLTHFLPLFLIKSFEEKQKVTPIIHMCLRIILHCTILHRATLQSVLMLCGLAPRGEQARYWVRFFLSRMGSRDLGLQVAISELSTHARCR